MVDLDTRAKGNLSSGFGYHLSLCFTSDGYRAPCDHMIGRLRMHWQRRPAPAVPLPPAEPRSFRLLFVGATGFLLLMAGYTSMLIMQRQEALQNLSRYNVTWLLSQAAVEVARLEAAVGNAVLKDKVPDHDVVQLWLDIVHNRVQLFDSG